MIDLVDRLRDRLRGPLPGHDAFFALSGYDRPSNELIRRQHPPPRESAVLALIYGPLQELHLLLMLRPTYDGVHSGQVSFPGGRKEPDDTDLCHTALREFAEETGATTGHIEVLGALTEVYIPPSRSLVKPFVGYAEQIGPWRPDVREVARLIEVPLADVLQDDILVRRHQFVATVGRNMEMPCFELGGETVWGATALMIAELRQLLAGHHSQ